ncbi:holo-ACP synthase [Dermatobacter hominis]|uniref:holo-ACP synthase n=1 Tax=Dermatobacter hominis TaxID=2884263 RepID=UPI001D10020C|nr:holo-ACP synthase [Dermatobacter hominis]UDY33853.1 holo-ACP synthase [Dermatobacter hominis]
MSADAGATGGRVVGVGTDLVEVPRLRAALERTPALLHRLFTPGEQSRCQRHEDPLPHLAARFAAKEAVMKALGKGMSAMAFTDIEVTSDGSGAPGVRLSGRARRVADERGVATVLVSLTHTGDLAQAHAVATT